ncbi:MAG: nucleotidyltransferase family protein [Clostridium sp.]
MMQLSEKTGIKQNVLQAIIKLAKDNDVRKLILFGSRARGDYKERSDIDLAFYGGNSSRFILEVDEETPTLLQLRAVWINRFRKIAGVHREEW